MKPPEKLWSTFRNRVFYPIIAIIAIIIDIETSTALTSEELDKVGTRRLEKLLSLSRGVSKDKASTHKAST